MPETSDREKENLLRKRGLLAGAAIWSVYFCDLTGDAKPELCSTVSFGSGNGIVSEEQ